MPHIISDTTREFILTDCDNNEAKVLELVHLFMGLTSESAEAYIRNFKFHWPPDVAKDMAQLGQGRVDTTLIQIKQAQLAQRYFMAAAWLAGASWRQLGHMFEIKYQTAEVRASKILPAKHRHGMIRDKVTYTQLSGMWNRFEDMLRAESIDKISQVPLPIIAAMLLEAAEKARDSSDNPQDEQWDNDGSGVDPDQEPEPPGMSAAEYLRSISK